jgi:hypothetical protein
MDTLLMIWGWIMENGASVLVAAVTIALLIPGDFPENILYKLGDMLSLISRKPVELPKKK